MASFDLDTQDSIPIEGEEETAKKRPAAPSAMAMLVVYSFQTDQTVPTTTAPRIYTVFALRLAIILFVPGVILPAFGLQRLILDC